VIIVKCIAKNVILRCGLSLSLTIVVFGYGNVLDVKLLMILELICSQSQLSQQPTTLKSSGLGKGTDATAYGFFVWDDIGKQEIKVI